LGAQSNKGGRGQINREEIGAGAASRLVRAFLRLRHSVAPDKTTMLRRVDLKYIAETWKKVPGENTDMLTF